MADNVDGLKESSGEPCKATPDGVQNAAFSVTRDEGGDRGNKVSYSPSTHGFPPSRPLLKQASVLAPSRLSGGMFPLRSSVLTSSPPAPAKPLLLRPSQLAVGADTVKIATSLEATSLSNPFAKVKSSSTVEQNEPAACKADPIVGTTGLPATPKFVPLGTKSPCREESLNTSVCVTPIASPAPGFVFGQNLHERVAETVPTDCAAHTPKSAEGSSQTNTVASDSIATTNGTEEMLFTSVLKKEHQNDSSSEQGERPVKSLDEAAREYEEARSVKRKYDQVMVVTGEEDESNVLQINCKLFAFSKVNCTWAEHGRGMLRLNDKEDENGLQSRVVVRMTGSLRVLLNTKVWTGMKVERASQKSVRLTAQDSDGQVKVFLIMATPKEAEHLYTALSSRVARLCSQQPTSSRSSNADNLCSGSAEPSPKKSLVTTDCVLDLN